MRRESFCNELGPCVIVTPHSDADDEMPETIPSPPMLEETMFDEPEDIE